MTPELTDHLKALTELEALRRRLGHEVSRAPPWSVQLRRQARPTMARSSTAIDGYHVTAEEASAVIEGRAAATDRDQRARAGDALTMQHVAVLADDPSFGWCDRLLQDQHFEACSTASTGRRFVPRLRSHQPRPVQTCGVYWTQALSAVGVAGRTHAMSRARVCAQRDEFY